MGLLDDTAIFVTVMQQGGFSHAAKHLGLSNGMVSRRIAELEKRLGVTLIKRTTRQLQLTAEGELFWQHAQKIQQELDSALSVIHALSEKPTGSIRVSSTLYFGRKYLTPLIVKFLANFPDIKIELVLTNQRLDPVKDQIDLLLRGYGYLNPVMEDSNMVAKVVYKQKINLYASPDYLIKYGEPTSPEDLHQHSIIGYADTTHLIDHVTWSYTDKNKPNSITLYPKFMSNDVESCAAACVGGFGIGKINELIVSEEMRHNQLRPILMGYDWGSFDFYAIYPQQKTLPKRTRLLLDFIIANTKNWK